jgi:hypothetical protein
MTALLPNKTYRVRNMDMVFFMYSGSVPVFYFIADGQVVYYMNPTLKSEDVMPAPMVKNTKMNSVSQECST